MNILRSIFAPVAWVCVSVCTWGGVPTDVRADVILSAPQPAVTAGAAVTLDLTLLNETTEPMVIELPDPIPVRLQSAAFATTLAFAPERSGPLQLAPGAFVRVRLTGMLPAGVEGTITLASGLAANVIALQADAQPAVQRQAAPDGDDLHDAAPLVEAGQAGAPEAPPVPGTALVDKPPPLALYAYEPMYILVGGDDGLNAKFQLSLRFRMFDGKGRLASRLPWIDDLYLSFSQTSLWDLNELSKPFRDSSYRPRLFFLHPALTTFLDGRLHVGVEGGVGHESNGKEGEESRSFNMLYLRPVLSLGDPQGFRMYAAPLIHNYMADGENPDLKDYRGYVDWSFGIGSKGGLDVWTTLRKGRRSDFGSVELNVSYPLSKLSGGDLTGWLMLQYFGGYGESLLDYRRKLDSQLRLGIAIAL